MCVKVLLDTPERYRFLYEGPDPPGDVCETMKLVCNSARHVDILFYDWGYIMDINYKKGTDVHRR
jgi:hypothetical protein